MKANPPHPLPPSLWPRALAIHFAVFIAFLAIFISWAVRQSMDLVHEDYYHEEMLFQKRIDSVDRTRAFARETAIQYDGAARTITIQLPIEHVREGVTGKIHLYRPSDARLDRHLNLALDHAGAQRIGTANLQPGLWKVRAQWSANGRDFYFDRSIVTGD
jgi:nitrogen fixation protein FixH